MAVRNRPSLPSCGEEALLNDDGPDLNARRCLWSAYERGQPAEFITTRTTTEGDPITFIYRVLAGGTVEVFIDSTHDRWSAMTWLHLICPGLTLTEDDPMAFDFGPGISAERGGECKETSIP